MRRWLGSALAVLLLAAAPGADDAALPKLTSPQAVLDAIKPRGRPVLVHFWATWCPGCVEEFPLQVKFAGRAKAMGLDVVFVNADGFANEARVRAYLKRTGAEAVARHAMMDPDLDPDPITAALDPKWTGGLPGTFGILPDGTVAARILGEAFDVELEELLAKVAPRGKARASRPAPAPAVDGGPPPRR